MTKRATLGSEPARLTTAPGERMRAMELHYGKRPGGWHRWHAVPLNDWDRANGRPWGQDYRSLCGRVTLGPRDDWSHGDRYTDGSPLPLCLVCQRRRASETAA